MNHHGFLVVVGPAKSLGLGFAGLLCVLWAEGATRCRWYLGLRDWQVLGHAPGSLSPKDAISTDRRYAAVARRGARPISSSSGNRGRQGSPYRPVGKAKLITRPIATPPRLYRSARGEIARVAPNWSLGAASLEVTSPHNIVPPGKPHRLLCEISHPDLIVLPGKRYRPCEETLSSCPGTNIVLPRNPHRPLRESISSHRGKVIVPLRKCT
jgi:hypothetical protein